MKKIVIDARMIFHSGIGTYIQNVLRVIDTSNFSVTALVPNHFVGHSEFSNIFFKSVTLPVYSPQESFVLHSYVDSCDIFISPHFNVPFFKIPAKKRIVIIHDVFHLRFPQLYSLSKRLYAKFLISKACALSDIILTVSHFSKHELSGLIPVDINKITVVYNGVDSALFTGEMSNEAIAKARANYNLPQKYLLFVGSVKPHKNLVRLLQAFALLLNEFPNLSLVIAGKKDGFITPESGIQNTITTLGIPEHKIIFTGYIPNKDIGLLYRLSALTVFPTLYEGFGLPVLEAMLSGSPCVISNIPVLREVYGDAAFYCDPYDYENIAASIKSALSHESLPKPMQLCINTAIEKYSIARFGLEFNKIITEAAETI